MPESVSVTGVRCIQFSYELLGLLRMNRTHAVSDKKDTFGTRFLQRHDQEIKDCRNSRMNGHFRSVCSEVFIEIAEEQWIEICGLRPHQLPKLGSLVCDVTQSKATGHVTSITIWSVHWETGRIVSYCRSVLFLDKATFT